jgi:hypothetical protein
MKKLLVLVMVLITGLALGFIGKAEAVTWGIGDVIAGTASGTVEHWRTGSGLLATYGSGGASFQTGMAFDSSGNLFVTNFEVNTVSKLAGPGDPHTASLYVSQGNNPETIVFDKLGNAYVGSASNGDIKKYDSAGNPLGSWNTGFRADWIDLNAANTKIFFTEDVNKGVFILDLATSAISTFNAAYGNFALRLLGDGSVIVANREDIKLLDSAGNLVRSYDVYGNNAWFALNLDPDGKTFWSADFGTGLIQQFDITTGATLTSFSSGSSGGPWGLAVFGEITQGGGGGNGGGEVPEPMTMLLLGSGLIGLWGARKKFKK